MIIEITGLPGNGKTLYAIKFVKEWAERENRPVFYSGIADLTLPWTEIEPEKWYECPTGAIIVIDECQRVFRPRSMGKEVPDYVAKLETHRHQGVDLVLITQHPLLTDTAVRRLCGQHFHVVRKWGTQNATIHEWPGVRENCDKPSGRKDSIRHHWKFDKKLYSVYKSADLHTHKRRIPMRVIVFCVLPFILAGLVWYVVAWNKKKMEGQAVNAAPAATKSGQGSAGQGDSKKTSYKNAREDARQFVFDRTARLAGLPHTSPRYDEVTKPVTAPIPAACLSMGSRCNCYTQQGTLMQTEKHVCLEIVKNGYFVDFDLDGGKKQGSMPLAQKAEAVPVSKLVPAALPESEAPKLATMELADAPQNRVSRPHLAAPVAQSNTTPAYK